MTKKPTPTKPSWDSDADRLAREVIDLCASALRDLNNSQPLPTHWLDYLKKSAWPKTKRGRPPIERNTIRDKNIARKMLGHYIAIEKGITNKTITNFAEDLAMEYRTTGRAFEAKDIFDIFRTYELDVMSQELAQRLTDHWEAEKQARAERARQINTRMAAGESLEQILRDPALPTEDFREIRRNQIHNAEIYGTSQRKPFRDFVDRHEAIRRWIDDGIHLGIDYDPVPDTVMRVGTRLAPHKKRLKSGKKI